MSERHAQTLAHSLAHHHEGGEREYITGRLEHTGVNRTLWRPVGRCHEQNDGGYQTHPQCDGGVDTHALVECAELSN